MLVRIPGGTGRGDNRPARGSWVGTLRQGFRQSHGPTHARLSQIGGIAAGGDSCLRSMPQPCVLEVGGDHPPTNKESRRPVSESKGELPAERPEATKLPRRGDSRRRCFCSSKSQAHAAAHASQCRDLGLQHEEKLALTLYSERYLRAAASHVDW